MTRDCTTKMVCEFHLQDPTAPDTVYLFEAIVKAADGAQSCTGLFAFASSAGVDYLIRDGAIQDFLRRSRMSLVVGIDAVTGRDTLEHLRDLEQDHERLSVRVFRNPTNALFHPKVARFEYPDGGQSMVVGSGNLTPGGLRRNFEAFSVMRAAADETLDVTSWDRFFTDHAKDVGAIDEAALERAAQNVIRGGGRQREQGTGPRQIVEAVVADVETPVGRTGQFLVTHIPAAGNRWRQVGFNIEVIRSFFRVQPDSSQRVFLQECQPDNTLVEPELPRPCVYSQINKNHRIEIGARPDVQYPTVGRPIAVFRELQTRSFAYMLLMPGEVGYEAMSALLENRENVGRVFGGVRRVTATRADVHGVWPDCPLVTAIDALTGTDA